MSRDILKKIDSFMAEEDDHNAKGEAEGEDEHLTKKQKTLPKGLKDKIIASKKKKK